MDTEAIRDKAEGCRIRAATFRALAQNSLRVHGRKLTMPAWDSRTVIRTMDSEAEAVAFHEGARYACEVMAHWEDDHFKRLQELLDGR